MGVPPVIIHFGFCYFCYEPSSVFGVPPFMETSIWENMPRSWWFTEIFNKTWLEKWINMVIYWENIMKIMISFMLISSFRFQLARRNSVIFHGIEWDLTIGVFFFAFFAGWKSSWITTRVSMDFDQNNGNSSDFKQRVDSDSMGLSLSRLSQ